MKVVFVNLPCRMKVTLSYSNGEADEVEMNNQRDYSKDLIQDFSGLNPYQFEPENQDFCNKEQNNAMTFEHCQKKFVCELSVSAVGNFLLLSNKIMMVSTAKLIIKRTRLVLQLETMHPLVLKNDIKNTQNMCFVKCIVRSSLRYVLADFIN